MRALLEVAKCPCCDGSGGRYDNYGNAEQCQWCYERSVAIAAPGAPADLPECGCCGQTGECDADCDARQAAATAPTADGTTSDKYRAELYDEVWQRARDMGYGNVTDALVELERMKAAAPVVQAEPVAAGTQKKRERWIQNIDSAIKCGLPKELARNLLNTKKEIENSIHYGGTKRLRDRIAELEAQIEQQPVVAVIGFYKGEREPRLLSWNCLPNGENWLYAAPVAHPDVPRCQCCGYLVTQSEHRGCLRSASPHPDASVLVEALERASKVMWSAECNLDVEAQEIERVLTAYRAALAGKGGEHV